MKTLFLTNTYLTGNSGGVYATKAYINAFAILSEKITVVYAIKEGDIVQDIILDKVEMVPVWDNRTKLKKYVDLCLGTVNRFQKNIFEYVNIKDYDTVVFNNSNISSGLIKKFKQLGLRTITIHHNYQIEYLIGDCSIITLLPSLFWTYIYEGAAVRNSDLNLTLTNEDIDLLKKHYGGRHFANIGVFEFKVSQSNRTYSDLNRGHKYLITGWLGSKQTEDSLIPWINKYYPILKEIDPNAELIIAGRQPSEKLLSLAKQRGIELIDSPVEMQPILDSADYYICPTDRGGGLKLRILDGLKSGLLVLSHKVSARGYDYMHDAGVIFTYDSLETFKEGIQRMLHINRTKMSVLNEYNNFYSSDVGTNRLKLILNRDVEK